MIRVGRFEVDAEDGRAVRHLLRCAWVPRCARELVALRALLALSRATERVPVERLAGPAPVMPEAPTTAEALHAVTQVLERSGPGRRLRSGLALLQPLHAAAARRLLFLWNADDVAPFAVAKVTRAAGAATLAHEAEGLRRVGGMEPNLSTGAPALLAHGEADGLSVLVESHAEGEPLLRLHRLRLRAGAWHPAHFAAAGSWLGRFHAATLRVPDATGRGVAVTGLQGDAWSRNVIVRPHGGDGPLRMLVFVDWEAWREEGNPLDDVLHLAVATARADLAGRGERAEIVRASRSGLVRWLLAPGTPRARAVRLLLVAWHQAAPHVVAARHVPELVARRLADPEGPARECAGALTEEAIRLILGLNVE